VEIILLIAALITILWVATGLIGLERVRQWLRLVEKPPYVVAHRYKQCPEGDPVIGEIFRAAKDAGRNPQWFPVGSEQTKMREGFELLRTQGGRRIIYPSKTLAHGDEIVMMALRASAKE
jgi:hypothetical protein